MTVQVRLHQYFRDMTGGREVVEANGRTVAELIDDLNARYPTLRDHLLDTKGRLQGFVEVFVNNRVVHPSETLMPVNEGDEVEILMIVAGG